MCAFHGVAAPYVNVAWLLQPSNAVHISVPARCRRPRRAVSRATRLAETCAPAKHAAAETDSAIGPSFFVPLLRCVAIGAACSVRGARKLVAQGRVTVDGRRAASEEEMVANTSSVSIFQLRHGKVEEVHTPERREYYLKLFKPRGVICSHSAQNHRPIVSSFYPAGADDCHYVGRLDRKSEGLLFVTTDGFFTRATTMPETHLEKEYLAVVPCARERRPPSADVLDQLRNGVTICDGPAHADIAEVVHYDESSDLARLRIVVTSGRYHMVRRMLRAIGYGCLQLLRVRVGSVGGLVVRPTRLAEAAEESLAESTGREKPVDVARAKQGSASALQPGEFAYLEPEDVAAVYQRGLKWLDIHHPVV